MAPSRQKLILTLTVGLFLILAQFFLYLMRVLELAGEICVASRRKVQVHRLSA